MLNKPKFWDLKKPNFISFLLRIFTIPIIINNFFLNLKRNKTIKDIKTICIGNIYIGGTGKTPTTIKLYELLKNNEHSIITAKKFYSTQIDEQILLRKKTNFIVDKNRKKIIEIANRKNVNLVIFDDGLQDRSINYDIQFVCFNSEDWIGNGQLIPAGPLREKLSSLKKYDAVFLRNENLDVKDIKQTIKKINNKILIFDTNYEIKNLTNLSLDDNYLIFSGIGSPKNFKNFLLNKKFNIVDEIIFPDHYKYKKDDIIKIKKRASELNAKIITTEKDYVKIHEDYIDNINFVKIDLKIHNENDLIDFIKRKINEKY